MEETQNHLWGEIATLEIRHLEYQMVLIVRAEVADDVEVKMKEIGEMYPNEVFTMQGSTCFLISGGYNWNSRWRDFKGILDKVLGIQGTEVVATR